MPHLDPGALPPGADSFLTERHLATLTLVRPTAGPHVTPIGFTYEPESRIARVITWADSWKARHLASSPDGLHAAICSVDGARWLTLYGTARVTADPAAVAEGVRRYAARYRPPKDRADRVVIEVTVDRIVGRVDR